MNGIVLRISDLFLLIKSWLSYKVFPHKRLQDQQIYWPKYPKMSLNLRNYLSRQYPLLPALAYRNCIVTALEIF